MENGKEVTKMPVLLNGETVWVEVASPSENVEGEVMELDAGPGGPQQQIIKQGSQPTQ